MVKAIKPVFAAGAVRNGNTPFIDVGSYQAVGPQDFNTIYNVKPLLKGSRARGKLTGAGVAVAVIEQTDIQPADWQTFRFAFGLSGYAAPWCPAIRIARIPA